MKTNLGACVSDTAWAEPSAALMSVIARLECAGTPLCEEFAEMLAALERVAGGGNGIGPIGEVLEPPMTEAEATATLILATLAAWVRDARVDDENLLRLIAAATPLVARFDSYLAARDPRLLR
jgi:hypothetical protein